MKKTIAVLLLAIAVAKAQTQTNTPPHAPNLEQCRADAAYWNNPVFTPEDATGALTSKYDLQVVNNLDDPKVRAGLKGQTKFLLPRYGVTPRMNVGDLINAVAELGDCSLAKDEPLFFDMMQKLDQEIVFRVLEWIEDHGWREEFKRTLPKKQRNDNIEIQESLWGNEIISAAANFARKKNVRTEMYNLAAYP